MSPVRKLCVYCGSGNGRNPAYQAAAHLGEVLLGLAALTIYDRDALAAVHASIVTLAEAEATARAIAARISGGQPRMLSERKFIEVRIIRAMISLAAALLLLQTAKAAPVAVASASTTGNGQTP